MSSLVLIDYTNYKGLRSIRPIRPIKLSFEEENIYHGKNQWILEAWDFTKAETRLFAMKDIHCWVPIEEYFLPGDRITFRGKNGSFIHYCFPLGAFGNRVSFAVDFDSFVHSADISELKHLP